MANTWLAGFIIFFYLRSVCRYVSIGVLHWDDLDQEQRSEITRIIPKEPTNPQMVFKRFIGSFDVFSSV